MNFLKASKLFHLKVQQRQREKKVLGCGELGDRYDPLKSKLSFLFVCYS